MLRRSRVVFALPHLSIDDGLRAPEMVIVRANSGIKLAAPDLELSPDKDESVVTAIFFLISPKNNPGQHLRILAQIARRVDADTFPEDWTYADGRTRAERSLADGMSTSSIWCYRQIQRRKISLENRLGKSICRRVT